jgi:hypothetical protein
MKTTNKAQLIHAVLSDMATSKVIVTVGDITKFLDTIEGIRNVKVYGNTVTVNNVVYPISEYQIDANLAKLVGPRAVLFYPTDLFGCKDIRVHETADELLSPARFIETQWKIIKSFRKQPNMAAMSPKIVSLDSVHVVSKNGKVAIIGDQNTYSELPTQLGIVDALLNEEAFTESETEYTRKFVINMFTPLASK